MSKSNPLIPITSPIVSHNYDDLLNTSSYGQIPSDDFQWTTVEVTLTAILGVIVLGTIIGNLFVLIHFTKSVRLKGLSNSTPTHFFIANLALADFLVGILVLPYFASLQVTGKWYFGQCFCTIWVITHFWLCAASILSTCAVCIERYIGVKYPIQHMRILNPKRILMALVLVWVLAGIPSVVRVFAWTEPKISVPYKCIINQKIGHAIFAAGGIFYLPATIMIILYFRIYRIAIRHMNSKKTGQGISRSLIYQASMCDSTTGSSYATTKSGGDDTVEGSTKEVEVESSLSSSTSSTSLPVLQTGPKSIHSIERRQVNLVKKLGVLVGVVLASYGPYFTLILLKSINQGWVNPNAFDCFAWIRYFNRFLNPFIYAYAVPAFNNAFQKSFVGRLTTNRNRVK